MIARTIYSEFAKMPECCRSNGARGHCFSTTWKLVLGLCFGGLLSQVLSENTDFQMDVPQGLTNVHDPLGK